ncbi:unnamed protein product [Owenia fusiformis]|uniref:Serine-threonine/tyrosine-protein kinase catalytic domain-containing protein n=1 Tax=Owenia fusiformis TaxID=6347 RepID=A0A8S4PE39_OWEFU|nr:unnamed protein product [Owenia fusiformis]
MQHPSNCSTELYEMMVRCWDNRPMNRPTFQQILIELEIMLTKDRDYLELDNIDIPLAQSTSSSLNDLEETLSDLENDNVPGLPPKKQLLKQKTSSVGSHHSVSTDHGTITKTLEFTKRNSFHKQVAVSSTCSSEERYMAHVVKEESVTGPGSPGPGPPIYDFWVICNEKSENSIKNATFIVKRLEENGLCGYFSKRDSTTKEPSLNEIPDSIKKCKYYIVLFDEDFNDDNYNVFASETIFRLLVNTGELPRFIPLVIGVERQQVVPNYIPNFCLEFEKDLPNNTKQFMRLENTLKAPVPQTTWGF